MKPLRRFIMAVEEFRKLNPAMQTQQVLVFALVAEAGDRGVYQRDLADKLGLVKSAISFNCAMLGDYDVKGKPGYGLVYSVEDPTNRRAKIVYLTPKGKRMAQSIEAWIERD